MRRIGMSLLLAVAAGGWFLLTNYDFKRDGFDQFTFVKKSGSTPETNPVKLNSSPVARNGDTIRIASFNIQVFGNSKSKKTHVMAVLADVVKRFDVVAIQEIRCKNPNLLPDFVKLINAPKGPNDPGRHYDFVIGERLGRTSSKEQYAYIYDASSIEVDEEAMYTIEDTADNMHRPPLVCPFRVLGPPSEEAFTFTLINIHTDPDETDIELDALDDVYQQVRHDGRGEDDIILLGDLNVDDKHLGELGMIPGIDWMIRYPAKTNTRRTKLYDNIVYTPYATTEFTGQAGVFDLMKEFNLTEAQALEVSDHMPVWAEFRIREQGIQGPIATRPGATKRQ